MLVYRHILTPETNPASSSRVFLWVGSERFGRRQMGLSCCSSRNHPWRGCRISERIPDRYTLTTTRISRHHGTARHSVRLRLCVGMKSFIHHQSLYSISYKLLQCHYLLCLLQLICGIGLVIKIYSYINVTYYFSRFNVKKMKFTFLIGCALQGYNSCFFLFHCDFWVIQLIFRVYFLNFISSILFWVLDFTSFGLFLGAEFTKVKVWYCDYE